jgi:transcriptional regulator with XRE-family HTH domain
MDLLKLAQRVRQIRLAQNLTVDELARKCQFSKGFISQVENFRTTPSLKALNKISSALGVSVSDLIDGSAEKPAYTFGNLSSGVDVQRDDNEKYGIHYYALATAKLDAT